MFQKHFSERLTQFISTAKNQQVAASLAHFGTDIELYSEATCLQLSRVLFLRMIMGFGRHTFPEKPK